MGRDNVFKFLYIIHNTVYNDQRPQTCVLWADAAKLKKL